jgi:hypothetical protein
MSKVTNTHLSASVRSGTTIMWMHPRTACGKIGDTVRNPDIVTCKACRKTQAWKDAHAEIHTRRTTTGGNHADPP